MFVFSLLLFPFLCLCQSSNINISVPEKISNEKGGLWGLKGGYSRTVLAYSEGGRLYPLDNYHVGFHSLYNPGYSGLGITGEVSLTSKGTGFSNYEVIYRLKYLSFAAGPVLKYDFLYFSPGAYWSLLLQRETQLNRASAIQLFDIEEINDQDWGLSFSAGCFIQQMLTIGISYTMGLSNVIQLPDHSPGGLPGGDIWFRNRALNLSAGFVFGYPKK